MKLRIHHLQCIRYFVGNGYSAEFVQNMKEVITRLENDEPFELVSEKDDICKCCPNLVDNVCVTAEKVDRFDNNLKTALGVQNGSIFIYKDIKERMAGKSYLYCCDDCEWKSLCECIEKEALK